MMDEKDLKEYEDNIRLVQGIKLSNKYNYIQGKQITDHESGTRVYDINNSLLLLGYLYSLFHLNIVIMLS